MRGIGVVPSVINAVSAGEPSNSAVIRFVVASALAKSMPAIQSAGRFSATFAWNAPSGSRCAMIPFPEVNANMPPAPTAAAVDG